MSEKPIVFNYNDYLKLKEEVDRLRQENTNLRMRIEEEDKRQDGWSLCSAETPDGAGLYLTTVKLYGQNGKWDGESTTTSADHFHRHKWLGRKQDDVIAWQPLPEPWREKC